MKQQYAVVVLFALIIVSSLVSLTSYKTTEKLVTEDVNQALAKALDEQQSDVISADAGMLRQVLINLVKNAIEANAQKLLIDVLEDCLHDKQVSLYIGNDGLPIPAENRQSLFVPFFTTKGSGSGIGLSLSRRMVIQQGGMLELADTPRQGCHVAFVLSLQTL